MDKQDRIGEEDAIFINTYILSNTEAVISSFHRMTDEELRLWGFRVAWLGIFLPDASKMYLLHLQG